MFEKKRRQDKLFFVLQTLNTVELRHLRSFLKGNVLAIISISTSDVSKFIVIISLNDVVPVHCRQE